MSSAPSKETRPAAAILGTAGLAPTEAERDFLAEANPLGFILFARNVDSPAQVRALVRDLRAIVGRPDAPVLIDQEGGRVQRLRPPHWADMPPAASFASVHDTDPTMGLRAARLNAQLIGLDLSDLGIDVDCAPVLDVPVSGAHDIIGDRAYGRDPAVIAELGRATCEGLLAAGVLPVIKHIPGHGRARADSHEALPRVDAPLNKLRATDFAPFRALADAPWGMTAHIVYEALDDRPATTSAKVVGEVIRGEIGFDGLLLTDDLSMKALSGDFAERAAASLEAGCDVVLHCNGDMEEMSAVMKGCAPMTDKAWARFQAGREMLAARSLPTGREAA